MKVLQLSNSDICGGAARAAFRIHNAILDSGIDTRMVVRFSQSGSGTVDGPKSNISKLLLPFRASLGGVLSRFLKSQKPIITSPAIVPSCWSKKLNASNADMVHLHWINNEMMSISDLGKIRKPLVWTLHDMWAFCGAEHVTENDRWKVGYSASNRPEYESGFDLNRWTAARKIRHWTHPIQIVAPSRWLADCVKSSFLMRDWPVTVIPNPIDVYSWRPIDKALAREILRLPPAVPLVLFGAWGNGNPSHKGFDLLSAALNHLRGQIPGLELVVFGQMAPLIPIDLGFPVHYTGHLNDDVSLQLLYSSADVMVVPSRQEAFCQTASEAHACGTPVVAFRATGLLDVVDHKITGYLAKAYDTEDLARGLSWVLGDETRIIRLSRAARERAEKLWSYKTVAAKYIDVYKTQCKH